MVNPLDREEFASFLSIMDKEMPIITKTTAKTPFTFGNLPKNLSQYMAYHDNKFLNRYGHLVEEMSHRNPKNQFAQSFRNYQIDKFKIYGILNHDNFYKTRVRDGYRNHLSPNFSEIREVGSLPYTGINLGFATIVDTRINGAELETYLSSDVEDEIGTTQLLAFNMSTNAVVGQWYNQIATKRGTGGPSGNIHLGIYDDTGATLPNNLLGETGSISMPATSSYTYQDLSNGGAAATTTTLWAAACNSASGNKIMRNFSLAAAAKLKGDLAFSFGALPSPWTGSYAETTNQFRFKIRGN